MTPPNSHSELWRELEALDLDGDAQFSFSRRLARDNGWPREFAQRVVDEYKRFLFLAATADHPVTPSDEVDQAWHLHLVYTRSYWDELCGEVLGFPLHHGPTKGGSAEGKKFGDWYARTLESYQRAFSEEAPRDIWPEASVRFGEAPHFRRVNLRRVWMIRKPKWAVRFERPKVNALLAGRFALVLLLLLMAGCAAPTTLNVSQWNGAEFLGVFWTLCAIGVALALFMSSREQAPLDAVFPIDPLDAYEIARLKDGGNLAVDVALASLHAQGALEVTPGGKLRDIGSTPPQHPFERAVLQRIGDESSVAAVRMGAQGGALAAYLSDTDRKLRDAGLLLSDEVKKNLNTTPLAITLILLGIGGIRILVGLERQRPVGFLCITCVALICFAVWLAATSPRRSKRGNLLLEHLSEQYKATTAPIRSFRLAPPYEPMAPSTGGIETTALFFALAGAQAFPADIRRVVAPPSSDGGGGSSGDGGGGGSGGCGGGGCGGCGGG